MKVRSCTKYDFYGASTVPFDDDPTSRPVAFKWVQTELGRDPIMDGRWSLFRYDTGWKIGMYGMCGTSGESWRPSVKSYEIPKNWEIV